MRYVKWILNFFEIAFKRKDSTNKSITKIYTFEEQLHVFQTLGFELNEGIEIGDVKMFSTEEYEKDPFTLMYTSLGSAEEYNYAPITDRCWDFDTEAIECSGDYIVIIENLRRISRGEMDFSSMSDEVDIENGIAKVSFNLFGDNYSFDLAVDNDWVDTALFTKIVELTVKYETKGRYTFFDTGGQSVIIGYEKPKDLSMIRSKTGLDIRFLL